MELITPPLIKFMPQFTRHEPAARDPSTRKVFKKCPKKYFFQVVLGFKPPAQNFYMSFGSCYHKFREVLEREYAEHRAAGKNHNEASEEALLVALYIATEKMWKGNPPLGTKNDYLTKDRLIKSCRVAYDKWKVEKEQKHTEVLGTEQAFDLFFKDGKTRSGGKIDQIIRWIGKPWIRDFKTTGKDEGYYKRLITPNDQFSAYIWGGSKLMNEDVYGLKVEVLFNSKTAGPKIYELTATRTKSQLERWENGQMKWEEVIAECRKDDTWPENEDQCSWCEFHSVCEKPTEAAQAAWLQGNFKQDPWDFKRQDDE